MLFNTVTGKINNFVLSGGEMQDWSVNLAKGAIDNDHQLALRAPSPAWPKAVGCRVPTAARSTETLDCGD